MLAGEHVWHGQDDPTDADLYDCCDFEQSCADGATGRRLRRGLPKGHVLQGSKQDIGCGREPQPELVSPDGMGGRPVGEQIQLAFLDRVFHIPTGAVDLFVKMTRFGRSLRQSGDDKAMTAVAVAPLGLGHHPPAARPANRKTQTSFDARTAPSTSATQKSEPRTRYVDGTGDMLIDRLNESQLDQNYNGPVYYPGQPIPPFRAIDTDHLSRSGQETTKNTPSSHVM